jgi:ABC-type glycerol-3-phosphate transport system permease component
MRKINVSSKANYAVMSLFLLITLFPFYMLLITSFKFQDQIIHQFWLPAFPLHYENYATAFMKIWPYMLNSIVITVGIVLGVLINSSMAGFTFSRFTFFGKSTLYYLIIMLMMVPGFLLLIPQFILFRDMGMINTYYVQILAPMASGSALATMLVKTFFEGIPLSLYESAEIDGASEFRIFYGIALPLSKPIIATVGIINALSGWNNYIWPLVVTSGDKVRPVILAVTNLKGPMDQVQGIQFAGYIIASIPLIILFSMATKAFVSGLTAGAVKG